MRIKSILLLLLFPMLLISCGHNSIDESFASDDIPELNEETEIAMKRDFIKQYYWNNTSYKPQDVRILSYYGNYNENLAIIIDCVDPELSITKETISGYEFIQIICFINSPLRTRLFFLLKIYRSFTTHIARRNLIYIQIVT